MRVLALLALCIAAVVAVPSNPQRIAGGFVTTIGRYPQNAALLYSWDLSTYSQSCGGTILNSRSVLTAAHCVIYDSANRWRIRIGSTFANSGGVVHLASLLIVNPSFNPVNNANDIAIIRSATTFGLNNNAAAASIAGTNYNIGDNQMVWATGWGATFSTGAASEQLRHAQLWTVNQNTCNTRYGGIVTANMLCVGWLDVGGRGQCQGDAGSPLYHNNVVVGIASWSIGCDQAYWPSINTRISSFTTWIQANA